MNILRSIKFGLSVAAFSAQVISYRLLSACKKKVSILRNYAVSTNSHWIRTLISSKMYHYLTVSFFLVNFQNCLHILLIFPIVCTCKRRRQLCYCYRLRRKAGYRALRHASTRPYFLLFQLFALCFE